MREIEDEEATSESQSENEVSQTSSQTIEDQRICGGVGR